MKNTKGFTMGSLILLTIPAAPLTRALCTARWQVTSHTKRLANHIKSVDFRYKGKLELPVCFRLVEEHSGSQFLIKISLIHGTHSKEGLSAMIQGTATLRKNVPSNIIYLEPFAARRKMPVC